jgi:hypothetical protein
MCGGLEITEWWDTEKGPGFLYETRQSWYISLPDKSLSSQPIKHSPKKKGKKRNHTWHLQNSQHEDQTQALSFLENDLWQLQETNRNFTTGQFNIQKGVAQSLLVKHGDRLEEIWSIEQSDCK